MKITVTDCKILKNVTIVGVGALGSHLVQILRNTEAAIKVIDFDRVEQKNTASQFHTKSTTGKSKVQGLQQTMKFLWGLSIEAIPHKLTTDNVRQLLGGSDLVIDCLDNGESRRIIQKFVREEGIPCLHGALDAEGSFGQVIWDADFKIDDEPSEGAATCEDGQHIAFIVVASAYLARAAQEFLANGRQIGFQINPGGVIRT